MIRGSIFSNFLLAILLPLALHASDRPNFIFILIDDMGWKDVGFAGSELAPTPNIDALAKKGLIFKQAYASAVSTLPATGSTPCSMTVTPRDPPSKKSWRRKANQSFHPTP
ncbi:hypothetical protein EBX31_01725 [bacterium]|nr:hypothetical protein [bacterium]